MLTANRSFDLVDPLQGYTGLALFPQTFEVSLEDASKPYHFDHELQSIHNRLKSMALRSPDKLREQAKVIVDGSSKVLNSKVRMDNHETTPDMAEDNPRERRPALGRKRARFSLKTNSSQPARSFKQPKLDIKSLRDPEEFFEAFERHENAKREIQKQMGGTLSDIDEQNPSQIERPRRPGILGRSAKYKHLYSLEISEIDKNVMSSQETFDSSIQSPVNHSSQSETDHNFTLQEEDIAGSIYKDEDKVDDEIFDQLLSCNSKDLEGDRALSLLQQHLQIKPIEIDKLHLPDFQDIPKIDLKSSKSGKLPKRSRVLLDRDNLLKGLSSKTPMRQRLGTETSVLHIASPTPSESPLSSLPLLNQGLLRSNSSNDPFSAHEIYQFPAINPSFIEHDKQFDLADVARESETKAPSTEQDDNIEAFKTGSPEAAIRDFTEAYEKSVNDDTSKLDAVIDVDSIASHVPVDDYIMDSNTDNSVMDEKLCGLDVDGNTQANGANVEDMVEETLLETVVSTEYSLHSVELTQDNLNKMQSHLDKPSTASIEEGEKDGHSRIPEKGSEQLTEIIQENSRTPLDKKRKAKLESQKARKRREISGSGRKSLGGAGTKWESGVRRSTRIRCRPLEYWKGERLLYARIHKSLPTVIGLKYASPEKGNGKLALKVKSYVSDEHKELLEIAARH